MEAHNRALHLTAKSAAPVVAMLLAAGELNRYTRTMKGKKE